MLNHFIFETSKSAPASVFRLIRLETLFLKMSEDSGADRNFTREEVLAMMDSRKEKEDELLNWLSVLEGQGVGMDDPLIDNENYPSKSFGGCYLINLETSFRLLRPLCNCPFLKYRTRFESCFLAIEQSHVKLFIFVVKLTREPQSQALLI